MHQVQINNLTRQLAIDVRDHAESKVIPHLDADADAAVIVLAITRDNGLCVSMATSPVHRHEAMYALAGVIGALGMRTWKTRLAMWLLRCYEPFREGEQ